MNAPTNKTKTKTLKQIIENHAVVAWAANGEEVLMIDPKDVAAIFKEWLQQKQERWRCTHYYYGITKLLEELEQK